MKKDGEIKGMDGSTRYDYLRITPTSDFVREIRDIHDEVIPLAIRGNFVGPTSPIYFSQEGRVASDCHPTALN